MRHVSVIFIVLYAALLVSVGFSAAMAAVQNGWYLPDHTPSCSQ